MLESEIESSAALLARDPSLHPTRQLREVANVPFEFRYQPSRRQRAGQALVACTLLPLRALLLAAALALIIPYVLLATWRLPPPPLSPLRRLSAWPVRVFCRVALLALGYWYLELSVHLFDLVECRAIPVELSTRH